MCAPAITSRTPEPVRRRQARHLMAGRHAAEGMGDFVRGLSLFILKWFLFGAAVFLIIWAVIVKVPEWFPSEDTDAANSVVVVTSPTTDEVPTVAVTPTTSQRSTTTNLPTGASRSTIPCHHPTPSTDDNIDDLDHYDHGGSGRSGSVRDFGPGAQFDVEGRFGCHRDLQPLCAGLSDARTEQLHPRPPHDHRLLHRPGMTTWLSIWQQNCRER